MKTLFQFLGVFWISSVLAQGTYQFSTLDTNETSIRINSNGVNFFDMTASTGCSIPKNSGTSTLFAQSLWFSANDENNNLHYAAEYFGNNVEYNFGPIGNTYNQDYDTLYNKVWKVSASTINYHIQHFQDQSYVVPQSISQWPGNGNPINGELNQLAPYVDFNSNFIYDPENGDYPCIKGDQALFTIFNDKRNTHQTSKGLPLGIEVHALIYSYANHLNILDSTFFISYKIINRSEHYYHNFKIGVFSDFDIGNSSDDYVGCDTLRNAFFSYNSSNNDLQFGNNPPAEACVILNRNMNRFIYYENTSSGLLSNPDSIEFVGLLNGYFQNSTPLTYGNNGTTGTIPTNYAFPGNVNNSNEWSQVSSGAVPFDYRSIGIIEIGALGQNQIIGFDLAYVYARSSNGNNLSNVNYLKEKIDEVTNFYLTETSNCEMSLSGTVYASGTILNDGIVALYNSTNNDSIASSYVTNLINGHFKFENINVGTYKIKAIPASSQSIDYLPTYYGDVLNFSDAYNLDYFSNTFGVDIHLASELGINDNFENSNITIFPNPTQNEITVSVSRELTKYIAILTNIYGQELQYFHIRNGETQINLSKYPSGLYLISIDGIVYKILKN